MADLCSQAPTTKYFITDRSGQRTGAGWGGGRGRYLSCCVDATLESQFGSKSVVKRHRTICVDQYLPTCNRHIHWISGEAIRGILSGFHRGHADILAVEDRCGSVGGNRCRQHASRNRPECYRPIKHAFLPRKILSLGSSVSVA